MNEIRKLAYEYIFALVAEWYSDKHNISNVEEFNKQDNSLKTYRLSMYPFFFAMANGTSESLFRLLGPFYTEIDGPIAQGVLDGIIHTEQSFLLFETTFNSGLKVKENIVGYIQQTNIDSVKKPVSWRDIKNLILDISSKVNGKSTTFKDIKVKNNEGSFVNLYKSLESSLEIIKEQSNNSFIDFDNSSMRQLSYNYYLSLKDRRLISYDEVHPAKGYHNHESLVS